MTKLNIWPSLNALTVPRAVVVLPCTIAPTLNEKFWSGVNAKNWLSKSFSKIYETATPSVVNVWVPVPWPLKVSSWLLFALDLVVDSLIVLSSTLITKYLVLVDRPPIAVVPCVYVNPSPVFVPWEAMVIVSAPVLTDAGATPVSYTHLTLPTKRIV